MPKAERLSEKWTVGREAKLRGQLWNFEDNLSAEGIILRYTNKPKKGVYLFYNPPNNFSRRTLVDSSCIFWVFFPCFSVRNCQLPFYLSVTGFCKMFFFLFSLTNSKFSVNVCSFLGFPSVEIKSDDGYQIGRGISSDNHRPILYHVISFIQWEPAEIIRWVIRAIIPCPTNMVSVRVSTTAEILKLFSAERNNGGRRKSFRGPREDFAK